MVTRGSQKVDLSSQVTVGGNVHVFEEQRVGISMAYAGSDVVLSRLLLSLYRRLIPRLYLFGGMLFRLQPKHASPLMLSFPSGAIVALAPFSPCTCTMVAALLERGNDHEGLPACIQERGLWRPKVLHEPKRFFV